ncbi:glycosyltransferase family 2 protein, partial [candidate division KSB1 bacterium]|nr:glycosyltransferase family 2 protein [candidate division KSB1 bacterium]
ILVIDNNPASTLKDELPSDSRIKYLAQNENRGYVWARNYAVSVAQGEILFYLDDDAAFAGDGVVETVCAEFSQEPALACAAFQIRNFYTKMIVPREFPHPDVTRYAENMFVSYYVGAGHALKKAVCKELGPLLDMEYGAEELEYSYRLLQNNYCIKYVPTVVVLHKASPKGRHSSGRNVYYSIRNRFWTLSRHLPWRYLLVNLSLWLIVWSIRSLRSGAFRYFLQGVRDGLQKMHTTVKRGERHVLTRRALNYLKQHGGRLWF